MKKKTDLQPKASVRNPPATGPIRGMVASTMYKYEYIFAPRDTENRSLTTARKIIIVEASAKPWNRRSRNNGSMLDTKPEKKEQIV